MDWNRQRTSQLLLLFLLIFIGTAVGSVVRALYPDWGIWENMTFRQGMGLMSDSALNCIFTSVFWLAVMAASGLSVMGTVVIPLVLLMRGAALGAVLEHLYADEGLSAIGKILLFIMPYACTATLVMLFGARESLRFSVQIAGLLCEKTPESMISVKLYIIRFAVLFIFLFLLGLIQNFLLKYGYFF